MPGQEAPCRVAVGGESEVSHVVQDEEILPVPGERLHERGHPEVVLRSPIDVPGRRMHPVWLEESDEAHRRTACIAVRPSLCRPGLHQVQQWQGDQSPGRTS